MTAATPGTTREEWAALITRHLHHPETPGGARHWAPELECCSRERLAEIQGEKLRLAVRYMFERSPLFARKCQERGLEPGDVAGVPDLTKLPVITKDDMSADLAEHPPWGTYSACDEEMWLHGGWQVFQTSGTTSTPRPFRYTQFDRRLWAWTDARALYSMEMRRGRDSAMLCFGYGPHVAMWGLHYALNLMGIPIVTGGGLDTRARAGMIDRYGPTTLACTPSYALYLAATMRELGLDPARCSVQRLICMGEAMPPTTEERIRATWEAAIHQFYGCTEAAPSCGGYTCPHAVHFMEDTHLIETVDPDTLTPVAPGTPGVTVVTNLCSEASPQIRFLVGDFTTLAYEPCECGRTHVRAQGGFSGRADDMLNIRGVTLFPSAIENLLRSHADVGDEFEIVVTRERNLDEITLVVEPAQDLAEAGMAQLARRIEDEFRAALELRPRIEVRPPGSLPKTEFKAKRVKDRRAG